jgi:hypothetical protein
MKKEFIIDINKLHVATRADGQASKTIEELLAINKLIPARKDSETMYTTEKQLNEDEYNNKDSRGEIEEVTERQFKDRNDKKDVSIIEVQLEEASPDKNGHKPEAWDTSDKEIRGHKNVQPIWLQVYKQEDERKKQDKNQLEKKLKNK